ncbi:MAG: cobyrinate a,c-diamide synthase [Bacteroidaceae bacterium]|nr:cobyrinate a,c-diamide synthase [Bacteroidaceae bacterium]
MKKQPQFLIAAPTSGSGKTTISRGLMDLLVHQGLRVQPFKCGPDYIDTKFHAQVCQRPSYNLDTFMASEQHVRELYAQHAQLADVCIVEGMMGMYDGYDRYKGSCAEIARVLGLPVVLVVNAQSAAYSMAPLLNGFMHFNDEVEVAGVIFNKVGSERHFAMLQQVCDDVQLPCFGYLTRQKDLEQSSRYLGLDFSDMKQDGGLADLIGDRIDWKALLAATEKEMLPMEKYDNMSYDNHNTAGNQKIYVARNEDSFSFIYAEHLDVLQRKGEVRFFNPEEDFNLPADTDLLYLPGGYPEKHATALTTAEVTRTSIKHYVENGGHVLAECGGMIYLTEGILADSGAYYEMVGVLPFKISMRKQDRKLSLGYRQFTYGGQALRGHEFHYTQFAPEGELPTSMVQVYDARGRKVTTPVFRYKNVVASYTHLYFAESGCPFWD